MKPKIPQPILDLLGIALMFIVLSSIGYAVYTLARI